MRCIHRMEYYLPLKRKETLACATTWMNLENIMLNEISRSQKTNTVRLRVCEVLRVVEITESESGMMVAGGRVGRRDGESWFPGYRVPVQ